MCITLINTAVYQQLFDLLKNEINVQIILKYSLFYDNKFIKVFLQNSVDK